MFIAFLHTGVLDKWVFCPRSTEDERLEQNVHILINYDSTTILTLTNV